MKAIASALLALGTLVLGAGCTFYAAGDDRADLTTGSHIPKKYPPGSVPNDNVQVVKPTAGDKAYGEATAQPMGSRDPNR